MSSLPTYDVAREEARASPQDIVDQLPRTAQVSDESTDTPYPCDEGFIYTGHWTVQLPADFDTTAFAEGLPASAGDGFELAETQGPSERTTSLIATHRGPAFVDVSDLSTTEANILDLLALSRCAESPDPEQ